MQFAADFHIHSPASRATSPELALPGIWAVAQRKGLQLVGTGDCLHPARLREIEETLEEAGDGFLRLRPGAEPRAASVPGPCRGHVRFVPTVEISNIYKRDGAVRKVHNLIILSGIPAARKLQARLAVLGSLEADGRPILGLDSRDLLQIVLESDPAAILIPAHIWTPWFSVLGSKSGFDSITACYADLAGHIRALETGLSSDPPMNRRLSSLDPFVLVSSSDAHSPDKLGREATLFDTAFTYEAVYRALTNPADTGLAGTVEFFPEEGKYHYDGHRACAVRLSPQETRALGGRCPTCGKPLTVGVMARVEELADRAVPAQCPSARPHVSCVPLAEIVAEALRTGETSKAVRAVCEEILSSIGPELTVLRSAPLDEIGRVAGPLVAEGIGRMRRGEVAVEPGYDGEFGSVSVIPEEVRERLNRQMRLFAFTGPGRGGAEHKRRSARAAAAAAAGRPTVPAGEPPGPSRAPGLNDAQKQAVAYNGGHLVIVAGPGTGKTHTLVHRIARVVAALPADRRALAVTFTNRAADELHERLEQLIPREMARVTAGTFHRICLRWLREFRAEAGLPDGFRVASELERAGLAARIWPERTRTERAAALEAISAWKSAADGAEPPPDAALYQRALRDTGLLDFDDLLRETLLLLTRNQTIAEAIYRRYAVLFVDEFQDMDPVQIALVGALAGGGVQVTAIGDPDQSIYGFRGAAGSSVERLRTVLPGNAVIYLSENYRSAPSLLKASLQVIAPARDTAVPALVPVLENQGMLVIHEAPSERAEAEYVVHQIERLVGGTSMFSHDSGRAEAGDCAKRSFGDIAVFYRLNALQGPLREAFDRSGIPYQVSGEHPPAEHAMSVDLLTCLRLAQGQEVQVEAAATLLQRILPGFGEQSARRYAANAGFGRSLGTLAHGIPTRLTGHLQTVRDGLYRIGRALGTGLAEALAAAASTGWWDTERSDGQGQALWSRIEQAAAVAPDLDGFCDTLIAGRSEDLHDSKAERVALMTLHAAKGLEFPVVFVVGCEEHILPLDLEGRRADIAEERRLFYVAMSRARECVYLLRARRRLLHGTRLENAPSRFLTDIEEQLKQYDVRRTTRHLSCTHRRCFSQPPVQMDLFGPLPGPTS